MGRARRQARHCRLSREEESRAPGSRREIANPIAVCGAVMDFWRRSRDGLPRGRSGRGLRAAAEERVR